MSEPDHVHTLLQSLGFTDYESRAYLSAIGLGTARFSELAADSEVPQQRIYDVVDDLRELGLVEVHEQSGGNEVVARPPDIALEDLKRRRVDMLTRSVDQTVDQLQRRFARSEPTEGFLTVVDHEDSARRHMRNVIEEATWWLSASVSISSYEALREEVEAAAERGVTVHLLVQGEESEVDALTFDDRIDVRHRPSADRLMAADRAYAVFQGIGSSVVSRPYLVTRNENLVVMLQRYRRSFWMGSQWLQRGSWSRRRYLNARDVIIEIRDTLDAGDSVDAYIEGIDTDSGAEGSWDGRIVNYELSVEADADPAGALPYISTLQVETDAGVRSVGGWDATVEDVAAYGIEIRHHRS